MGVTHRVSVNMAGASLNRFDSLRAIEDQFIADFLSCLCRTCFLSGTSNLLHADPPMRMSLSTMFTDVEAAYDQDHAMRSSFESSMWGDRHPLTHNGTTSRESTTSIEEIRTFFVMQQNVFEIP